MICGMDVTIENVNRVLRFFNVFIPRGCGDHSQTQQKHGIKDPKYHTALI